MGFVRNVPHPGLACSSPGRPQTFSTAEILSCDLRCEYPRKEAHSRCMSTRGSPPAFCSRLHTRDWSPRGARVPKSQPIFPFPGSRPLSSQGYSILRAKTQQISMGKVRAVLAQGSARGPVRVAPCFPGRRTQRAQARH